MEDILLVYWGTLVIIFGLLVGSFLNVCIYRLPIGESIVKPASHCMTCGKRLTAFDLIPVFSYIFLRGKCRHCKTKFSPRYAFVELLTAGVYFALYYKYGLTVDFASALVLMSILIAMVFIDFDHQIIPDELVITGLICGIPFGIYNYFHNLQIFGDANWWNPLVGVLSASAVLLLIAFVGEKLYKTEDAMGMGDVKIYAAIGIFLGWKMTLFSLFATIMFAGLVIVILLLFRVVKLKNTHIPLGPFIGIGVFYTYLFGWDTLYLYLNTNLLSLFHN